MTSHNTFWIYFIENSSKILTDYSLIKYIFSENQIHIILKYKFILYQLNQFLLILVKVVSIWLIQYMDLIIVRSWALLYC